MPELRLRARFAWWRVVRVHGAAVVRVYGAGGSLFLQFVHGLVPFCAFPFDSVASTRPSRLEGDERSVAGTGSRAHGGDLRSPYGVEGSSSKVRRRERTGERWLMHLMFAVAILTQWVSPRSLTGHSGPARGRCSVRVERREVVRLWMAIGWQGQAAGLCRLR